MIKRAPTALPLPRRALAGLAGAALLTLCGSVMPALAQSGDAASHLAAAVPPGTSLVVAEQNDQASIAWKRSGASDGAPYRVTFANFNGGPAVLEAVIAGGADIGYVGEAPLPIALGSGVDSVVAVALFANPGSPGNYFLVAQPNSGITTVEDLRGRTVAYPPGTGRHMALSGILHQHGLDLGGSVKGVQLAGTEVAPTFSSRGVDAAIVLGQQLFRLGKPPVLADGRCHNWGLNALVVRKSLLDDPRKSAAVADYLRRAVALYNWQGAKPDEWIKASYVEKQGLTFEQGKFLYESEGQGAFYPIDQRAVAVFQEIADGLRVTGALKRNVAVAPYLTDRFNEVVIAQNKADGVTPRPLVQPVPATASK